MTSSRRDDEAARMGLGLKGLRHSLHLSQSEVATGLGLSKRAYALWESGHTRFTTADLPRLATVLGVSNTELLVRLGLLPMELPAEWLNGKTPDGDLERRLLTIRASWPDANEHGRSLSSTLLDSAYRILRQSRANAKINHGPIRRELVRSCPVLSTQSA